MIIFKDLHIKLKNIKLKNINKISLQFKNLNKI